MFTKTYNNQLNYIIILVLVALVITIITVIVPYKFIHFGIIYYTAAGLLVPVFYSIIDIIAEIYGYKLTKWIMVYLASTVILFYLLIKAILLLPPAQNQVHYQMLYLEFFKPLGNILFIGIGGWLIGPLVNSYIISRWKILVQGRYFWIRSIGSSLCGETTQVLFGSITAYSHIVSNNHLVNLIIFGISYKIVAAILLAVPATMIVNSLKNSDPVTITIPIENSKQLKNSIGFNVH